MNIWNAIDALPRPRMRVVASIGNYDGVHLGHRSILRGAVERARRIDAASMLITFEPHPLEVVAPERRPPRLQTRGQRLDCLERTGLTDVLILAFDLEMAALSGPEFFDRVLLPRIEPVAVHVGENFGFGRDRSANLETLREIGRQRGFEVHAEPAQRVDGQIVSSSAIRRLVAEGEIARARAMLGRPYALRGEVVHGVGRGRELQFPTANLDPENEILPRAGVYVTETVALASRHPSVTNVGCRPTFGGHVTTVETHLLEFSEDLYGEVVEVHFLERIRDEQAFAGPLELADQIARDRAATEAYFRNVPLGGSRMLD